MSETQYTRDELAAIRARLRRTWSGRWTVQQHYDETVVGVEGSDLIVCAMPDTEGDRAAAEFIAHARADIPALLDALDAAEDERNVAEDERDDWRRELIAAADALSPSPSVLVGGRGVALAATQMRAERDAAEAKVARVEAWARNLTKTPPTSAVTIAAIEVGHEALRRLEGGA